MSLVLVKNACRELLPEHSWKDEKRTIFHCSTTEKPEDHSIISTISTLNGSQVCFLLKGCRVISQKPQSLLIETSGKSRDFLKTFWKTIYPIISYPMKLSKDFEFSEEELEDKFSNLYIWISRREFSGKIYPEGSILSCFVNLQGIWKSTSKSGTGSGMSIGFNLQAKLITITSEVPPRRCLIDDEEDVSF
jgi:hypothetical protein